jgi:predicted ribosomally synthesized peptide with SipW-like signal peptide
MTDKKKLSLSRRQALAGLGAIGLAGAGAGFGTSALFSDTESFNNNSIEAGTLDLVIDYETSVSQDGVNTGSTANDDTIQGGESGQYVIKDAKPGDSGELKFCPKIVDNPGWLFVGSAGGVTDYENGQTEPEEDADGTGGGGLTNPKSGQGAGELSEAIQVSLEYCDKDGNTIRPFNNPDDYTLADLFKDLETGFLLDGEPDGQSGPQAYPSSPDEGTQNGPCLCIDWEIPTDVGNEIQSDGVEFDVTFTARQERNNSDYDNPFVDLTVGPSGGNTSYDYNSIQDAVNNANSGNVISVANNTFSPSSPVTVGTSGLTIAGAGESQTEIDASDLERGMAIEADGVTVCDLTVDNAGSGVSSGEVEGIFVGDANDFTDEDGIITIRDVTVSNVDAGDSTAEGIHVKSYNSGDPIDGVSIKNVTIDGVDTPDADGGANGIKLQSDLNNVTIGDTDIKNVEGSWSYGVSLTPASLEDGIPKDVSINSSTIADVTAITYDGVGVGIDSRGGGAVDPTASGNNPDDVADPRELSIIGTDFENSLDIGIQNKNLAYTTLNIDSNNTYESGITPKQGL